MNTFSTLTHRGAAILFSGVLLVGGLTLASRASAGDAVGGNPTCSALGYTHEYKSGDNPGAGTYMVESDGMEATLRVGTASDVGSPNPNNAIVAYNISTMANGYAVVVKGSNGATVYRSALDPAPLHAPTNASGKWPSISHFQLCWNDPPAPGQLVVTKVVNGTDTPEDYEFEFCVTPVVDGDQICQTVLGNGTTTFEKLSPGDYVLTESDPGADFEVAGSGATVTIASNKTATATVTNRWIPQRTEFGEVEVTKVVTGDGAPTDGTYRICVQGPDAASTQHCATIVGQGMLTFDRLAPGTYEVIEDDPASEYVVTIEPATVTVTPGGTATATVTNAFTQQESLPPTPEVLPPEVLPPTPEVVPPTTPTAPAAPVTPAAPATATGVGAQTSLPTTGSETALAIIAMILVATGAGLMLVGRRRQPRQL